MIKLSLINGDVISLTNTDHISFNKIAYNNAEDIDFQDLLQSENTLIEIVSKGKVFYINSESIVYVELSEPSKMQIRSKSELGL